MIAKVKRYVEQFHMIEQGDRIVVGVSGGADSICLLTVLLAFRKEYSLHLFVVHINHGIRGEEADADEAFVKEYCMQQEVSFRAVHCNVKQISKDNSWSEEEAGRNVRYTSFFEECDKNNCNKIAIAHNKNDNAETILFHLIRGSGIHGMTGIKPVRDKIIRPLLNCSRGEIEDFLFSKGISYRIDKTNLTEDYTRNKIRLTLLPFAEREINKKATEHIVSMAEQMSEVAEFIDKVTNNAYDEIVTLTNHKAIIDISAFIQLDSVIQKSLIRKIIFCLKGQLKDIEEGHIIDIIALNDKQVGKQVYLPYNIIVKKAYQHIMFIDKLNHMDSSHQSMVSKENENTLFIPVDIPSEHYLEEQGYHIRMAIREYKNSMNIPKNGYTKWFDYDKIKDAVVIRTRQTGDYLQISRNGGRKSLKSIFIDSKLPRDIRDEIPLICDGSHVLWILGSRTSEGFLVDESTKRVLVIELSKIETKKITIREME